MLSRNKWMEFCNRIGAKDGEDIHKEIIGFYGEPWRAYHDISHPIAMLADFTPVVRSFCTNPIAIELSIWGHDIIMDVTRNDNEERSAEWTRNVCSRLGLMNMGNYAAELVMATKHDFQPTEIDAQVLADLDLAILGKPQYAFDMYEEGIRAEYSVYPEDVFRAGRRAFLVGMLDREHIYSTKHFRDKFEKSARNNLERAITKLS